MRHFAATAISALFTSEVSAVKISQLDTATIACEFPNMIDASGACVADPTTTIFKALIDACVYPNMIDAAGVCVADPTTTIPTAVIDACVYPNILDASGACVADPTTLA